MLLRGLDKLKFGGRESQFTTLSKFLSVVEIDHLR